MGCYKRPPSGLQIVGLRFRAALCAALACILALFYPDGGVGGIETDTHDTGSANQRAPVGVSLSRCWEGERARLENSRAMLCHIKPHHENLGLGCKKKAAGMFVSLSRLWVFLERTCDPSAT